MATKVTKKVTTESKKKTAGVKPVVKKSGVKQYELVAIWPLSENEVGLEKEMGELLKKHGFKIAELDKWGKKIMAYSIKGESRGYYLRYLIEDGDVVALDKDLRIDDKILRYLLVRI